MGIDFLNKNKNILNISNKMKYKTYKALLISSKISIDRSIVLSNKKSKFSAGTLLGVRKDITSLQIFLYISYYENLYLKLNNWIFSQPGLSIFLIPNYRIIDNSYKGISSYRFQGLNYKDYMIDYRLFEKLFIIN